MRVEKRGRIALEGTVKSAVAARKALFKARDCMPDGEDRNEIIALAVHLGYALEDAGYDLRCIENTED